MISKASSAVCYYYHYEILSDIELIIISWNICVKVGLNVNHDVVIRMDLAIIWRVNHNIPEDIDLVNNHFCLSNLGNCRCLF